MKLFTTVGCENGNSTVTFGRFPRTSDLYFRGVLVRRAARPDDALEVCLTCLSQSTCHWNLSVASPPPNGRAGGVAPIVYVLFTVNFCHFRKVKMLDPSGCFECTRPRIAVLVLLGADTKNSISGCKDDCEQSVLQINPKAAHTQKLCPFTRNRLSLNGW